MDSISMAIASLSAAKDMAKAYVALKDEIGRQQLLIDLQGKILEAQGGALDAHETQRQLQREVEALNAQIASMRNQDALIATLERDVGFYFKPGDLDPYCPRCVEADRRLVHLAKTANTESARRVWICPACHQKFVQWARFKNAPAPEG